MSPRRSSNGFPAPSLQGAFEDLRADYNATKQTRFRRRRTGVAASGSSADYHYRSDADYLRMMELSRDFDRNDMIVGQGTTRLVDNIVQQGFTLDPQTGDRQLDRDLVARFEDWANDAEQCHSSGEMTFYDIERLTLRSVVVDGDIIMLPLIDGTLEPVEAHRLRTPTNTTRNVVHGVLLDERRRRLEYWFTRDDISPNKPITRVSDIKPYPARGPDGKKQVFHIYNPRRFSQTRGISAFAPIADAVGMHDDIQFANLVKAQVASCWAIIRERQDDFKNHGPDQAGERENQTLADGTTRTIEGIAPGMDITGKPGEVIKGFAPNIPNPEFFPHAMLVLTFVAVNLNLPVAVLLLDPSKTNFSGWRGAMDQAKFGFRAIQKWMKQKLHTPTYRWKLAQWIDEDNALRAAAARLETQNGNIYRHTWHPPSWPYIEPLKDATADLLRQRNGLTSPRRLHAERGTDWDTVSEEIVEDNGMAIRKAKIAAMQINADASINDGQPVHWRELLTLATPDGVNISINAGDETAPDNSKDTADA